MPVRESDGMMRNPRDGSTAINQHCPFCADLADGIGVAANRHAVALNDAHPLTDGHTLIVPRRHSTDLFELTAAELAAVWKLTVAVRDKLTRGGVIDFNLGANIGTAAGQTVDHAHLHLIPRRPGDVPDPACGIRCVIPDRQVWTKL
jgi:diadenosine tetraphosphate (Ap4A) HIT family hydrolase